MIKGEIEMIENENNLSAEVNDNFATDCLHEIRAQSKRWFIIAVIEFIGLVALFGWAWWCSYLPQEVATTISEEASADNGSTAFVGDNNVFDSDTEEPTENNV